MASRLSEAPPAAEALQVHGCSAGPVMLQALAWRPTIALHQQELQEEAEEAQEHKTEELEEEVQEVSPRTKNHLPDEPT